MFEDYIDTDILGSPMYWILTAGAELALLIGFKSQSLWNTEMGMSIWSKIGVLALIPFISYFLYGYISRR